MADPQSIEQRAKSVPFVGWSYAAANFRRLAATYAPGKLPVLILGPIGVGKETMAKAWQHVAGPSNATLPIVDLDSFTNIRRANIPDSCIATSSSPLPSNMPALDLNVARSDYQHHYRSDEENHLPKEIVSPFKLKLYMCPLELRKADILALLHYFNRVKLPKLFGGSYQSINPKLLADMLWHQTWPENALDLWRTVRTTVAKDSQSHGNWEGAKDFGELQFNKDIQVATRSDEAILFNEVARFDDLLSVAVQLYWLYLASSAGDDNEYDYPMFESSDVVWPEWPEFSREKWYGNCPNADDFRHLKIEEFARILIDHFWPRNDGRQIGKENRGRMRLPEKMEFRFRFICVLAGGFCC